MGTRENDVVSGANNSTYARGAGEGGGVGESKNPIEPRQEGRATIRTNADVTRSEKTSASRKSTK